MLLRALVFVADRAQYARTVLEFLGNYTFTDARRLSALFLRILQIAVRTNDVQLAQALWKRIFQHRIAEPTLLIAPLIYLMTFDKFLERDLALCENVFRDLTTDSAWERSGLVHASATILFLNKQEYPYVARVHAESAIRGRLPAQFQRCYELVHNNLAKFTKMASKSPVRLWSLLDVLHYSPSAIGIVPSWINLLDLLINKFDCFHSAVTIRRYLTLFQFLGVISSEDIAKFDQAGYILSNRFPRHAVSFSNVFFN